jgi:hypothetical protein
LRIADKLAQPLRGPDAKLRPLMQLHSVAHRDDDVEIKELDLVGLPIGGSCCKICNNSFSREFPLLENVLGVAREMTDLSR